MNDLYFSLAEADALISKVRPRLHQARAIKREIDWIFVSVDYDRVRIAEQKTKLAQLGADLRAILQELEDLGCYVKDLDAGLIDFLSKFDGRDVFLCWKLGEPCVMHWHELDQGLADRQKIIDLGTMQFYNALTEISGDK